MTDFVKIKGACGAATIELLGAQMRSCVLSGQEVLWPGSQEFWSSSSPILFPVVGKLWNDTLHAQGKTHAHPMHGLVRHQMFTVEQCAEAFVRLACEHVADERFPWDYRLEVTYSLDAQGLLWTVRVCNPGAHELPFQLGFHPGFVLAQKPWNISWPSPCSPKALGVVAGVGVLDGTETLLGRDLVEMEWQERATALVGSGFDTASVRLQSQAAALQVTYDPSPDLWVFWSPSGAPFLCPEGWYGKPDCEGHTGEFSKRPFTRHLASGESFTATCRIAMEAVL